MRRAETEGNLCHFSTDCKRRKPRLHVYTGCKQKLALIPATQSVEQLLHFAESEVGQLCILGVYLKNYIFAGMPLCSLVLGLISLTTCVDM